MDESLLELDPLAALPLGDEAEPDAGGVLLEPLDALPEGEDELGEELIEPDALVEPPDAESFFVESDEEALEDDDGALGVLALPDVEPDAEPEGELGVVLEPADEDVEPGAVLLETARSPSLSQPVRSPAPSARETATAIVESLILWASVGWGKGKGARNGPVRLRS